MAELTFTENMKIERLFGMGSGYVLDFSNNTFQEFIAKTIGCNIYDNKYDFESGSKAKRLRQFFKLEPDYIVGLLLDHLLEYWLAKIQIGVISYDDTDKKLYEECKIIAVRLKQNSLVVEIESVKEIDDSRDLNLLVKSIKDSIIKNEPENALDRIHTYTFKYLRTICSSHNIEIRKDESLNAVYGKYVKFLVSSEKIESMMTERILKFSINIIEAFNDIRNNKSFAHDNPLLNYHESILILNSITSSLKFIESIEVKISSEKKQKETETDNWELPF